MTTDGYPTPILTESGTLPPGVTFHSNGNGTATLSGTPTATGTYSIGLHAANGIGTNAAQSFTLTVNQAPSITSASSSTFTVGAAGSFSITSTGYPLPTITESGALPSGVTFTDNGNGTATLSGTPRTGAGGVYDISITASNDVTPAGSQAFTLTVDEASSITSASATTFTVGSSGTFTVTTAHEYPSPPAISLTGGSLPPGVTFTDNNDGTATLSGTPPPGTGGVYHLSITAANGISPSDVQSLALTVDQAPSIGSGASATFTVGSDGTFSVIATGYPTPALTEAGALPDGVIFIDNGDGTATLSGTPAVGAGGVYSIRVIASNGVGTSVVQAFTLTVDEAASITSASSTIFSVGSAGSFSVATTGYPTPVLTMTAGTLPDGVTFVDNGDGTATLSGSPVAGAGGTYPITVSASNGVGLAASQPFTLTVDEASVITSAASATLTVGTAGTFTVTTAHQFPSPPTISITSGSLPAGVTFVDNGDGTATLSGTPAAGTGGVYDLSITASNGTGAPSVQAFTLTVEEATSFASPTSTAFTVGSAGSFLFTTAGYPIPTLTQTAGTLPAGVTFVDNGDGTATLSGTPTTGTGGVYDLSVTASNGIGAPALQAFVLTVDEAPSFSSAGQVTFTAGTQGSFVVTTIGFPTLALTETGVLPSGVTFVDNGDGTATLSGSPATGSGGVYDLSVTGSNGSGGHIVQPFTITVDEAPAITSSPGATFTVGSAGTFSVTTTGYPTPALTPTAGTLPAGVTFVDNGDGTATLSGVPVAGTGGAYPVTFTASNGVGQVASQPFTLTVDEPTVITSAASETFTVGTAGTFAVSTAHEYPPPSISITTGTLPAGVTFVDNEDGTATLSGAPVTGTGGIYQVTITASNGVGMPASQPFTLTVDERSNITSGTSTTFTVGTAGTFTVTTSQGYPTQPAISLTGGTLPAGVNFVDNGDGTATLSGKPATGTAGVYNLTIEASNGVGTPAIESLKLTVDEAPSPSTSSSAQNTFSITSADGTTFTVGSRGTFSVTTSGDPPVSLAESGALPAGVIFTDNGDGTATLSGKPAKGTAGLFNLSITASSISGPHAVQAFTLTVDEAPSITSAPKATFTVGTAGSFTVTTSSTEHPAGPSLSEAGTLPAGITFRDNHNGTATISGVATAGISGVYKLIVRASNGVAPDAAQHFSLTMRGTLAQLPGYWLAAANGAVFAFGDAKFAGAPDAKQLVKPVVSIAATPDGKGYWLAAANGAVFAFGDAKFAGAPDAKQLVKPVVSIAATPDGKGYWLAAANGAVFAFGDAKFAGAPDAKQLVKPVVSIAATPDGKGYWLAAANGAVFAFGDAKFAGAPDAKQLVKPVVSIAATPDGKGYWLAAANGAVFAFGDAKFAGAPDAKQLVKPVVSIAATPDGKGYWLAAANGAVFAFGDAKFAGAPDAKQLVKPIVGTV